VALLVAPVPRPADCWARAVVAWTLLILADRTGSGLVPEQQKAFIGAQTVRDPTDPQLSAAIGRCG